MRHALTIFMDLSLSRTACTCSHGKVCLSITRRCNRLTRFEGQVDSPVFPRHGDGSGSTACSARRRPVRRVPGDGQALAVLVVPSIKLAEHNAWDAVLPSYPRPATHYGNTYLRFCVPPLAVVRPGRWADLHLAAGYQLRNESHECGHI